MKDIALEDYEGDISIINGDFSLTEIVNQDLRQILFNRLSTQNPDWYHHTLMGGDLEEMTGEPNTRSNANKITAKISRAINYKDPVTGTYLIDPSAYDIRTIPIDKNTVLAVVTINNTKTLITFDYTKGISEVSTT